MRNRGRNRGLAALGLVFAGSAALAFGGSESGGPFVNALRLVHAFGKPEAASPASDGKVKGALYKAVGKDGLLTLKEMSPFMSAENFKKIAGSDESLDPAEALAALQADTPASRRLMHPEIVAHLDKLATSLDRIEESKREAGRELAAWIASNYRPGKPLHVIVICTGNTRRSILGSMMGNVAAAYCGMPEIRFHCGGTAPTAINPRSITALKAVGIRIEPTGKEAPRGEEKTANPIHRLNWGGGDSAFECLEFSKRYDDASNPAKDFAALMVCSEADEGCPLVKGAALRLSIPYVDPKIFDDSPYEAEKYAERRDDEGRLLLSAMIEARLKLKAAAPKP